MIDPIEIVKNFNIKEFEDFNNAFPIYKNTGLESYIKCELECNNIDGALRLQSKCPYISFNLNLSELNEKIKQVKCIKLNLCNTKITNNKMPIPITPKATQTMPVTTPMASYVHPSFINSFTFSSPMTAVSFAATGNKA